MGPRTDSLGMDGRWERRWRVPRVASDRSAEDGRPAHHPMGGRGAGRQGRNEVGAHVGRAAPPDLHAVLL
eukprot:5787909-Prymnesium_polylepis.1